MDPISKYSFLSLLRIHASVSERVVCCLVSYFRTAFPLLNDDTIIKVFSYTDAFTRISFLLAFRQALPFPKLTLLKFFSQGSREEYCSPEAPSNCGFGSHTASGYMIIQGSMIFKYYNGESFFLYIIEDHMMLHKTVRMLRARKFWPTSGSRSLTELKDKLIRSL